jgi:hypothetical protein
MQDSTLPKKDVVRHRSRWKDKFKEVYISERAYTTNLSVEIIIIIIIIYEDKRRTK